MRSPSAFTSALALAGAASANSRRCQNIQIPIPITAKNALINLAPPTTNIELATLLRTIVQQGVSYPESVIHGYNDIEGTYNIGATYCVPEAVKVPQVIQVLTHGMGFDRGYWDADVQDYGYSYVQKALDSGYATLAYDRLGCGESQLLNPISEVQTPLEVAILGALADRLRQGSIEPIGHAFQSIIHVGHSYGSHLAYLLSAAKPEACDALVLTGWNAPQREQSFLQTIPMLPVVSPSVGVSIAQPEADCGYVVANTMPTFKSYEPGYIAPASLEALRSLVFAEDQCEPEMVNYAWQRAQPISLGELITSGAVAEPSPIKVPVAVITGQKDVPYCGGDCSPSILQASGSNFPNAAPFQSIVIQNAGNALNFENTRQQTFNTVLDFLNQHGLKAY